MVESKYINLFRECMESDVKPYIDDEIFKGLMDLLHLAIFEAYKKGRWAEDDRNNITPMYVR